MKLVLPMAFVLSIALSSAAFAQAPSILQAFRGGGTDISYSLAWNGVDGFFFAGSFEDNIGFFPDMISAGNDDIFVGLMGTGGNIVWNRRDGAASTDIATGVAVDGAGNCYVTGSFADSTNFDGTTYLGAGGLDVFIAKYNPAGALIWIKDFGGPSLDFSDAIAVDGNNDVYITGEFEDSMHVDAITINSAGGADMFLIKCDSSGTVIWAKSGGSTTNDQGRGVAADASGNVVVVGMYTNTASFDGTPLVSAGSGDAFAVRYDSGGVLQWARTAGGTEFDRANDVTLVGGTAYIVGEFRGGAFFMPAPRSSNGGSDFFLWQVISTGMYIGVTTGGGIQDDAARSVTITGTDIAFTGEFRASMTLGNTTLASRGDTDVFVAKIGTALNYLWAVEGGGTSLDSGEGIAISSGGDVYVTGSYSNTVRFAGLQAPSLGGKDAFIVKFNGDLAVSAESTPALSEAILGRATPNPFGVATTLTYDVPVRTRVRIDIYDVAGRRVRTLVDAVVGPAPGQSVTWDGRTDNGTFAPSGVYMCRMSTRTNVEMQKLVLLQ